MDSRYKYDIVGEPLLVIDGVIYKPLQFGQKLMGNL